MIKRIRIFILNFIIILFLNGCVAEVMLAGTAVSVASTAQEVEEEHNGSIWDYVQEKYNSLKSYVGRKVN